jgi:hypothetical protein
VTQASDSRPEGSYRGGPGRGRGRGVAARGFAAAGLTTKGGGRQNGNSEPAKVGEA